MTPLSVLFPLHTLLLNASLFPEYISYSQPRINKHSPARYFPCVAMDTILKNVASLWRVSLLDGPPDT